MFLLLFRSQVVPSLMCQDDDAYLLRQLVLMWSNYKLMASWLFRFFQYLDRFFIPRREKYLLSLNELTVRCFQDLVSGICSFLVADFSSLVQCDSGYGRCFILNSFEKLTMLFSISGF